MIFKDLEKDYPLLSDTASYLEDKCYFFKGVLKQIREQDIDYKFGEEICNKALYLCHGERKEYYKKVDTLIEFSLEFLRLQIELEKTGEYKYSSFKEVEQGAYNDPKRKLTGPWYTWALYFSQFFWVTHNNVFNFFLNDFVKSAPSTGDVLEVPTGTGLFLNYFLLRKPSWKGTGVDLSDSSIDFTKNVLQAYKVPINQVSIIKEDIYKYKPKEKFDRIMSGEFLEHLEDPLGVLKKLHQILKDNGKIFITVAVWAAMIDHIYLYKSAEEVREHIGQAGFRIEKELVQAVFKTAHPEQEKTPINYCAILTK